MTHWADKYGAQWYLHKDGHPPHDDDGDYQWDGTQWVLIGEDMGEEDEDE